MEPFLADFLLNPKIPKPLRYAVLAAISGFLVFLCLYCGIRNQSVIRAAVCFMIGGLMLVFFVLAARKIHKS